MIYYVTTEYDEALYDENGNLMAEADNSILTTEDILKAVGVDYEKHDIYELVDHDDDMIEEIMDGGKFPKKFSELSEKIESVLSVAKKEERLNNIMFELNNAGDYQEFMEIVEKFVKEEKERGNYVQK